MRCATPARRQEGLQTVCCRPTVSVDEVTCWVGGAGRGGGCGGGGGEETVDRALFVALSLIPFCVCVRVWGVRGQDPVCCVVPVDSVILCVCVCGRGGDRTVAVCWAFPVDRITCLLGRWGGGGGGGGVCT